MRLLYNPVSTKTIKKQQQINDCIFEQTGLLWTPSYVSLELTLFMRMY